MKNIISLMNNTNKNFSIEVSHLTKSYGKEKVVAVNDVSFNVNTGEIFGLIGPDGAGKTSIFRMLTTLLLPDGGNAVVNGFDVVKDYKKIRNCFGYMPGRFSLYQDLSVEENLDFFATVFNTTIEKNYHLIKDIYIQIEPFKKRRAGQLSGGMKQKLALCCALIHKPDVLFLDEPTTGVDPVSRKEFWEMLKRLKLQGITILVATPYMDEANMCDQIALLQKGKILSIDTPQNISDSYPDKLFAVKSKGMSVLLKCLNQHHEIKLSYAFGEYAHASFTNTNIAEYDIESFLKNNGMNNVTVEKVKPSIEDVFIKYLS